MANSAVNEHALRQSSDYYVTARTDMGGVGLSRRSPDLLGGTIEMILTNDTAEDYVAELIIRLTNNKQCLLRIVQKKG